jgi:hypothetical protein
MLATFSRILFQPPFSTLFKFFKDFRSTQNLFLYFLEIFAHFSYLVLLICRTVNFLCDVQKF